MLVGSLTHSHLAHTIAAKRGAPDGKPNNRGQGPESMVCKPAGQPRMTLHRKNPGRFTPAICAGKSRTASGNLLILNHFPYVRYPAGSAGVADIWLVIPVVPQVDENRMVRVTNPGGRAQPNKFLDTAPSESNPAACVKEQRLSEPIAKTAGDMQKARPCGTRLAVVKMKAVQAGTTAPSVLTRWARRDILRATVFLCSTPLDTPRSSSG